MDAMKYDEMWCDGMRWVKARWEDMTRWGKVIIQDDIRCVKVLRYDEMSSDERGWDDMRWDEMMRRYDEIRWH